MSICLCGQSAEKILDLIALKRLEQQGRAGSSEFETCCARTKEIRSALESLPDLERPIHLLVPHQKLRVCRSGVCSHVWSGIVPKGSLITLAQGVYAASPEFNALLEMRGSSRMESVLTLMMYCGIFAIDESSEDGFVKRPPLTNVSRLTGFAKSLRMFDCSHALLDAAELVLERARSPLEARLAIALTASPKLGGFGMPRPALNKPVRLGENSQAIIGAEELEADMLWPDRRVVLEANGKLRHEGRFGEDLTRASALEEEGYAVRFVTSQQLRSPRQMTLVGRWLSEKLGIEPSFPSRERLGRLLSELTAFEYHHISLE